MQLSKKISILFLLTFFVILWIIYFLNKYIRYFQFITGIILLVTGILIFNGSIQSLGFQLNSILPSLEMLLI